MQLNNQRRCNGEDCGGRALPNIRQGRFSYFYKSFKKLLGGVKGKVADNKNNFAQIRKTFLHLSQNLSMIIILTFHDSKKHCCNGVDFVLQELAPPLNQEIAIAGANS